MIKIKSSRFSGRYFTMLTAMVCLFCILVLQLYNLQIVQGETYTEIVEDKKTQTKSVIGQRGSILDVNGIPLAVDQKCYNVCFYRDPNRRSDDDRAEYTQVLLKVMEIVESNGGETIDEFWLKRDEAGEWVFATGTSLASAAAERERQWRANFALQYTAQDKLFDALCRNYSIPEELSEERKIKVLAMWQESRMKNFLSAPVTIAYNVSLKTVAEIEALTSELDGISIAESTARVYPRGSLASHVIGYIGSISSESAMTEYKSKGYSSDAKVGVTGIEYSMEDQLTPNISYRQGKRVVEVNSLGKVIRELSYEEPIDGNTVVLTLDTRLQSVLETALKENIEIINAEQQKIYATEKWQKTNAAKLEALGEDYELKFAESGAAVVMDPNTGAVLAMASSPDYDLNWFVSGTDSDKLSELFKDERNPMFNRAISAKDTPGSIFKMCTALASLMEGVVTPTEKIDDAGLFTGLDTTHQPRCWVYPNYSKHSNQDVEAALKNSCNYYFYTVGLRLGSANLSKWAARLGLSSKTGIELPSEATSFVGNQSTLYDSDLAIGSQSTNKPRYSANKIKALLRQVGEEMQITYDEDRLDRVAKELLDIVTEEETKATWPARIRTILLQEMNLTNEYIAKRALGTKIQSYLNDLKWTDSETIMCAIGQSITQVTPVAVARYISALANGGTVYDAQIIERIVSPSGEVLLDKQPVVASTIDDSQGYLEYIKKGMHSVTSLEDGGTAAKYYEDSKYKDVICAKTGTAQTSSLIDLENKSWHVAFAPIDDPQIVVVVYIPNGYAGGLSAYTCKTVIDYYLDREDLTTQDVLPEAGTLAP